MFSKDIPQRVGYQCANYYRQLIKTGIIFDENYYVDQKGSVRCILGRGSKKNKRLGDITVKYDEFELFIRGNLTEKG